MKSLAIFAFLAVVVVGNGIEMAIPTEITSDFLDAILYNKDLTMEQTVCLFQNLDLVLLSDKTRLADPVEYLKAACNASRAYEICNIVSDEYTSHLLKLQTEYVCQDPEEVVKTLACLGEKVTKNPLSKKMVHFENSCLAAKIYVFVIHQGLMECSAPQDVLNFYLESAEVSIMAACKKPL
uniref:Uncharacterized protein n=1 Tax=Panagrolaimus sp. JU765 TaxID=591449 RepID=A0AC34R0N2_9BILA